MPAFLMLAMFGALVVSSPSSASSRDYDAVYSAMLANPDSLSANADLLRVQLDQADFQAASVTLQRMLLINPNFDRARLVRVAVFIRLGDHAGALEDLAFLENRPLNDIDRVEADRLAHMVRADPTAASLAGVLRTGVLFDSNPSLASGSGTTTDGRAFNAPVNSAFGAFGELQLMGELPFGDGAGHSLRAQLKGFARLQDDDTASYSFAQAAIGPRIDLGFAFVDVMALAGIDFDGGDKYAHHLGGRLGVTVDLSDRLSATVRIDAVHEALDVNRLTTINFGDADGTRISIRPEFTYRLSHAWQVSVHGSYAAKDADSTWYSYTSYGAGADVRFRNAAGISSQLGVSLRHLDYDAGNPNSAATLAREDTRYNLDGAIAVPLSVLAETMDPTADVSWARGWSLEGVGRYTFIESNSALFQSDAISIGFSLARRFSM